MERKGENPFDLKFQSTPSAWRETQIKTYPVTEGEISIHSLRMEGDELSTAHSCFFSRFQSTPSAWRETCCFMFRYQNAEIFQSTPSAWRETHTDGFAFALTGISIHSLRMEGDEPA